jgi:hypothetical protein
MNRTIDLTVFGVSVAFNLLLVALFIARKLWGMAAGRIIGIPILALAVPAAAAVVINIVQGRPWWTVLLPSLFVAYSVVELLFDYILKLPWRTSPLLGPYLALYYTAQVGLVGYSFSVGKVQGFVALGTYFLSLAATAIGHGPLGGG